MVGSSEFSLRNTTQVDACSKDGRDLRRKGLLDKRQKSKITDHLGFHLLRPAKMVQ